jgi:hypothetical protein
MAARPTIPHADALLCALVLAPNTYARNQFFDIFENTELKRVRRRAKRARALIRQILGQGREPAEIVGEQIMDDRVLLRLQITNLSFQRTTSLAPLEAALVHYAVHKARGDEVSAEDVELVERALQHADFTRDRIPPITPTS